MRLDVYDAATAKAEHIAPDIRNFFKKLTGLCKYLRS
jgi:hypothetical protein